MIYFLKKKLNFHNNNKINFKIQMSFGHNNLKLLIRIINWIKWINNLKLAI